MRGLFAGLFVFLITITSVFPAPVSAQRPKTKTEPPPKPRPVKLRTKDGIDLDGFYFGSNKGKKAIPVLLVHEWKGQKNSYAKLCMGLRNAGCAVLALDYRGHGGSREYTNNRGDKKSFNLQTMNKSDVGAIVTMDLEEAKRFLKRENNDEKLNLNALTLIGVRDGAVLAAAWAQRDWSFPNVGSRKQSQDVKALIFVSPERLLKGISVETALKDPRIAALPTLFVVGQGSKEESDTERIYKRVSALKRKMSGKKDPPGLKKLSVREPLGGPNLVNESASVIPEIIKFITDEVQITDNDNPWILRE